MQNAEKTRQDCVKDDMISFGMYHEHARDKARF